MIAPKAPTWLEVDLAAVERNIFRVQSLVGPSIDVRVVVKANAYGHGLVEVGLTAEKAGAPGLAVALLEEGVQLRDAGVRIPILVLSSIPVEQADEAVRYAMTCCLCSLDLASALSTAAIRQQRPAHTELKVDTGMGRLGVLPEESRDLAEACVRLPGLSIDGVFSHMSSAEDDAAFSEEQIGRFDLVRRELAAGGNRPRWKYHLASSAGTLRYPRSRFDAVRVGLLAYGLNPVADIAPLDLEPAMQWKARISYLKDCPANASISYGRTFVTPRPMKVATLNVGYADGFGRSLSNRGNVLIGGRRAPVIGRVCMDQMMAAVPPGIPARVGDEVVLLGRQGAEGISAAELAECSGTIMHELLARLGTRMPRVYSHESPGEFTAPTSGGHLSTGIDFQEPSLLR